MRYPYKKPRGPPCYVHFVSILYMQTVKYSFPSRLPDATSVLVHGGRASKSSPRECPINWNESFCSERCALCIEAPSTECTGRVAERLVMRVDVGARHDTRQLKGMCWTFGLQHSALAGPAREPGLLWATPSRCTAVRLVFCCPSHITCTPDDAQLRRRHAPSKCARPSRGPPAPSRG